MFGMGGKQLSLKEHIVKSHEGGVRAVTCAGGDSSENCSGGSVSAVQSNVSEDCSVGRVSAMESNVSGDCPDGSVSAVESNVSEDCSGGSMSAVESNVSEDRSGGSMSAVESNVSEDCSGGSMSAVESNVSEDCSGGSMSAVESNVSEDCSGGSVSAVESNVSEDSFVANVPVVGNDFLQSRSEGSVPVGGSDFSQDGSATALESHVHEAKLPKSFKEGQWEQKTDINILDLTLQECCTHRMSWHIQQNAGSQAWYPFPEVPRKWLGDRTNVERWDDFMQVIQAKAWDGIASVLERSIDTDADKDGCSSLLDDIHSTLLCSVIIIEKSDTPKLLCCFDDGSTEKDKLVEHALCYGRSLKSQFVNCQANGLLKSHPFHFDVEVFQIPLQGKITTLWNSKSTQP